MRTLSRRERQPHVSVEARRRTQSTLDETDRLILAMLQENARVSNVKIARRAGMVPSGVLERLRKLERRKVIVAYETRLDARALGLGLTAFVFVRAHARGSTNTAARLAQIAEVQEVHHVAGEDCYLVKVRASSPQSLGRILRDKILALPSVEATRTTIVLDTSKETSALPVVTAATERRR